VLPVVFALAAVGTPMTLQDAVSYALSHDPTVAAKYAAVTTQAHAVSAQEAQTFPTVNGTLQSVLQKQENYGGAYQLIGIAPQPNFSQNTISAGTNYTLNSGGLGFLQLATANASLAAARQDLARAEDLVASNVTTAFFNVAQKKGIVQLDGSDLVYQDALLAAARIKAREGAAAGVDVLRARVAQAKSASTLVGARADVQNALESLAHTIGAPLDTAFAIPTAIPEPAIPNGTVAALENLAVSERPDVASARKTLLAARDTRKGWDRELFPSLQIQANLGNQYSPTEAALLQSFSKTPIPRGSPGFWQIGLTSTFTLPLVDYGQRHTERVNDDAQIAADEAALQNVISQAQLDVRQQYRAAQTAQVQLAYAKEEASLGSQAARIAELQYRSGVIALADVIQAQQTSVQAQTDLIDARVAYVDAIVSLRVALGTYDPRSAVANL
jgi:outer membrane protein TolC